VDRFSQIGSKADLSLQDVGPILHDVVLYIQRRLPHMRKKVEIIEDYATVPKVPLNRALFEWVIENLLKNSIDAIKTEHGKINIKVRALRNNQRKIYVDISDNGIGIQAMNKNIIFKPGYSTKKRGWGLGLNLAKRIVEESHGGKLFIKETRIGEGTIMRITL
jgi:signal transduction histidine kinase